MYSQCQTHVIHPKIKPPAVDMADDRFHSHSDLHHLSGLDSERTCFQKIIPEVRENMSTFHWRGPQCDNFLFIGLSDLLCYMIILA